MAKCGKVLHFFSNKYGKIQKLELSDSDNEIFFITLLSQIGFTKGLKFSQVLFAKLINLLKIMQAWIYPGCSENRDGSQWPSG